MFFKDFVSVKRQKIKRGASQTYDTPSSRKQFNLFHNSLAVHQYELFSFYKSINLKINILLLYIQQNYNKK